MDYNETYIDHLQSVQNYMNMVMVPILLLCGTAGNIVSFIIYVRKWSAFTIPLLFLSCMDLLFLWSESIFSGYWVYFKESLETTTFGCKYSYYILQATFYASTYIVATFTVMRAYSVLKPLDYASVFTTKRTLIIISALVVFGFALESHIPIGLVIVEGINGTITYRSMVCDYSVSYFDFYLEVWTIVEEVVAVAGLAIIFIGNGIIAINLIQHTRGNPQSSVKAPEISRRLMAVSAMYFLSWGPSIIYTLVTYGDFREPGTIERRWMMLMFDFAVIPIMIQSAFGFLVYILIGAAFRAEVKQLIFRCKPLQNLVQSRT